MSMAALTPRVRTIVICDEANESPIEDRVFSLEGVRSHLLARSLPWNTSLSLFLLSSPRKGRCSGSILVVCERTDKTIRYLKFSAVFRDDNELLPMSVDINDLALPEVGPYSIQVLFYVKGGGDVLKGEQPFHVYLEE